jgi:predicted aconitase with swiveling domain
MNEIVIATIFRGRAVLPGNLEGEALVTRFGFNAYASFYNSLQDGVVSAECADAGNKELYGKRLDGKVICLPNTTGSTSAGAVWQRIAKLGVAPKAMLFYQTIDPLAAGGLIVADLWAAKRIVVIDQLGKEFLRVVKNGDWITLQEDGTVFIK